MAVNFTEQEKKSLVITSLVFVVLLLAMLYFKFSGSSDLLELEGGGGGGGVTVNFGDSDVGSGSNYTSEVLNVSERTKQQVSAAADPEEIIGSNLDDAPAVVRTVKQPVTKKPTQPDPKPATTEPKPRVVRNAALDNILRGNNRGGDGEGGGAGNQGSRTGSLSSGSYDGSGGSGGGTGGGTGTGNGTGTGPGSGSGSGGGSGAGHGTGVGDYKMNGRKALSKPRPNYNCNEEGTVVVKVYANPQGKVISATAGVRGTTNLATCLLTQAKAAAMSTTWEPAPNAPDKQEGTITYRFTLTD